MKKIEGTKIKASFANQNPCFYRFTVFFCGALICLCAGCIPQTDNEVVVYSALDREFAEPILNRVGPELDLRVLPKFDQERVYASDIKKIVQWFNILAKNDLLGILEETEEEAL